MQRHRIRHFLFLSTLALAASGLAHGQSPATGQQAASAAAVIQRYPHGSIQSDASARAALTEVQTARTAVESGYAAEQNACYSKFFASVCTEHAKEHRRATLEQLRAIEVDANYFLRKERADQRDRDLADKQAKDAAERADREQRAASNMERQAREEAKRQSAVSTPQGTPDPGRAARHEQKLKQMRAQQAAEAKQRAANVAAYERKVREAQERQQEVARKKAEKERERAANPLPAKQD